MPNLITVCPLFHPRFESRLQWHWGCQDLSSHAGCSHKLCDLNPLSISLFLISPREDSDISQTSDEIMFVNIPLKNYKGM